MRLARKKVVSGGCYYHLVSRINGFAGEFLFNDEMKEYGFRLAEDLSKYFLIEILSLVWMGNHVHLVVWSPGEENLPDLQTVADRHNRYYEGSDKAIILNASLTHVPEHIAKIEELRVKMGDISEFMKAYLQRFSVWYNKKSGRRGRLWGERFTSVILEGDQALWNCIKYVELNAVRAKIVTDPAEYRFCSWGRYCGTGKHPFAANLEKHLLESDFALRHTDRRKNPKRTKLTSEELFTLLRVDMARTIAIEANLTEEQIAEAMEKAKKAVSKPLTFLRRCNFWTKGAIIGSKSFVRETAHSLGYRPREEEWEMPDGTVKTIEVRKKEGRGKVDDGASVLWSSNAARS